MYELATRLFPICRSITGNGVRETLGIIRQFLPNLTIHEVRSGTKAFDWTVPPEWNIRNAALIAPSGKMIANFKLNNLHIVGYSEPIEKEVSLAELQPHLHSLPNMPHIIPYVTSYYKRDWGFCITQAERDALKDVTYRVYIDSTLDEKGSLTYGELLIRGQTEQEIFISTYICHPSLASDQVSGPVVTTFLADFLSSRPRRYSYRIIFIPETIGSIVYLSRNLEEMKRKTIAGLNVACVGDDRAYSLMTTPDANTLADRAARHALKHHAPVTEGGLGYNEYDFLKYRGSDERQYCSPGIDLPVISIQRTLFGEYREYHTSLDNMTLISKAGLEGGLQAIKRYIETLELNCVCKPTVLCEPQMSKRDLYMRTFMDILVLCDGKRDAIEIADRIGRPIWELAPYFNELQENQLLKAAA